MMNQMKSDGVQPRQCYIRTFWPELGMLFDFVRVRFTAVNLRVVIALNWAMMGQRTRLGVFCVRIEYSC